MTLRHGLIVLLISALPLAICILAAAQDMALHLRDDFNIAEHARRLK